MLQNTPFPINLEYLAVDKELIYFFYVLLTVDLSITLVNDQLNAQILFLQ